MTLPSEASNDSERHMKIVVEETHKGTLTFRSHCPPSFIEGLQMESGLGHFAHYSSIIPNVEAFETIARNKAGRVTLALIDPNLIVGYGVCWYPDKEDRWSALGDLMYEMAAVEVSRNFRGLHVGRRIMDLTMDDDFFEDKITYMVGLSWHWDLEGKGLTAAQYRRMMMDLYSLYGFREVYTNEPNITLKPENVMMTRTGSRVSEEDQKRFRYLRFGIKQPK
ncbi:MAG: N-acetyltransferase [Desulfomonile sp.]